MTYYDLMESANRKLDHGYITLGEYEKMIEPLKMEIELEKCGDCISRQELLNVIFQKEYGHDYDENTDILGLKYVDIIKGMPSVEPEQNLQPTCNQLATDSISREAALEVLDDYAEDIESGNWGTAYSKARASMCELPSVEPERKKGHWIMQNDRSKKLLGWSFCSECNAWIGEPTDYCSNCGADMREVDG